MAARKSRLRPLLSAGLAAMAVLLGATCVVLVAAGWPLSVAAGAAGLSAAGFAGIVEPRSKVAPAAFLVCVGAIGAALLLDQLMS